MPIPLDFDTVYRDHHRRVYSICLRMLKSPEEAEDLSQEAFLQIYRKLDSYRGDSALSTWLHRVTVNQCLMYIRRRKVKDPERMEYEAEQLALDNTPGPRVPINTRIALEQAINELAPGYRNVLLLHDIEGLEHPEIAQILGVTEGTTKSQLHGARHSMRKLLNKKANPKAWFRRAAPPHIGGQHCSKCQVSIGPLPPGITGLCAECR